MDFNVNLGENGFSISSLSAFRLNFIMYLRAAHIIQTCGNYPTDLPGPTGGLSDIFTEKGILNDQHTLTNMLISKANLLYKAVEAIVRSNTPNLYLLHDKDCAWLITDALSAFEEYKKRALLPHSRDNSSPWRGIGTFPPGRDFAEHNTEFLELHEATERTPPLVS
ncbi:hypothetical protein ACFL11_00135 [Patescibacteria group bacterium]